jgi:hypothetical protein
VRALIAAAVVVALVTVVLARLVRVLDEAELTLRTLAGQLRTLRRAVEAFAPLAGEVVRDSAAGEAGLDRLQALKTGERRRPSGTVGDGDGVGPVSLPLRPSPNRVLRPQPARRGRQRVERDPDQGGPPGP